MSYDKKKTYCKVFVNLGLMMLLILFCLFGLPRLIVCFMPFVVGWIIALIASPLVHFFEKRLKIRRKAGSAFVIIAVIAIVILGGYFIGSALIEQAVKFIGDVPDMWQAAQIDFNHIGENLSKAARFLPKELQMTITDISVNIQDYLGNVIGSVSEPTVEALGNFAKNIPGIVISIIMGLLFTYFYVADKDYIPGILEKILPESILLRFDMIRRGLGRAVGGYFKAQIKIEIWMYFLLGIGFTILRVKYAFIIAIGVAFLDFLPFFGTGTVLIPWAVIKFFSGDYKMVIGLLIIWGVGQLARQIIQPKIVGESMGLPPLMTLFLLYLGFKLRGLAGMILAVPVGLVFINFYKYGAFDSMIRNFRMLVEAIQKFRREE